MGFLNNMIDKARGWLGANPPEPTEMVPIRHDSFDTRRFRDTMDVAPALQDMAYKDLGEDIDYAESLVEGVFNSFWQADPQLQDEKVMRPEGLINHAANRLLLEDAETPVTRQYTKHDQYGSAMATIAVTDKVREFVQQNKELQEQCEQAKQEQDKAKQAQQDLEDAANEAGEQQGDYDGEGPLTEQQAAAAAALAQAQQQAQQAQQGADEAMAQAQAAAASATAQLRQAVHKGVEEAGDQLAEEASMMAAWGVDDGQLKQLSFKERAALAKRLRSNRLAKFRQLIGRFRMMAAAQRTRRVEYGRDEVVGVEMGDDLPRVLGAEFGKSKVHHAMRLDFLDRLANRQLLQTKMVGIEKIGDGAIICLIDNSGSMEDADKHGITREAWAKAMALALLDQARTSNRDFVGINFSSANQIKVYHFPKGQGPIDQVLEFCEHFFNGGTDFMRPIDRAISILEKEFNDAGKQRGDLVLITDGDCQVSPDWMGKYKARKHALAFRMFGIEVGDDGGYWGRMDDGSSTLEALSDNVRKVVEFADPSSVADIFRVMA